MSQMKLSLILLVLAAVANPFVCVFAHKDHAHEHADTHVHEAPHDKVDEVDSSKEFKAKITEDPFTALSDEERRNIFLEKIKVVNVTPEETMSKLISGYTSELTFDITNNWDYAITLLALSGRYIDPKDSEKTLAKLPPALVNGDVGRILGPNESTQLIYHLTPSIVEGKVGVIVLVEFSDNSQTGLYRVPAFADTIYVHYAPISFLDLKSLFLYAVAAGSIYLIVKLFGRTKVVKKASKKEERKKTEAIARKLVDSSEIDRDWVPAEHWPENQTPKLRATTKSPRPN